MSGTAYLVGAGPGDPRLITLRGAVVFWRADAPWRLYPEIGVLVLSQYLELRYAARLVEQHPERVGYLLKERVSDIAMLADALHRIAEGECVIDPRSWRGS